MTEHLTIVTLILYFLSGNFVARRIYANAIHERNRRKFKNFIKLVEESMPPEKLLQQQKQYSKPNALKDAINISIFQHKLSIIAVFSKKIEDDIFTYGDSELIIKFNTIMLLIYDMSSDVKQLNYLASSHESHYKSLEPAIIHCFRNLLRKYNRLLVTCKRIDNKINYLST
ncbi:hypothetical protein OGH69_12470 [Flavobacterium sp. MFBS3-15]|uniref:hypothetical protein n=1 Tax=Flavobacterium sp. MFBS3-15 TaxID=2989816 RepID=UPI002236058F|nr:hypothetical protein [Flavobacterium sp. MFBS3-15]MCW4469786.1 hypothetical protein [Flavobacterium sp. MFBS3-15]